MNQVSVFILPGIAVAIASYLLGSISFSIIFTRIFDDHKDIRSMGSGNAGMTNVLRSVGKLPALLTLVCDFGKGVLSVLLGRFVFDALCTANSLPHIYVQYGAYIAGTACVLGHIFPVFFKFKGGKGVLTSAAMICLIDYRVFLICFAIFILVFVCSRIVSLSSIVGIGLYPLVTFLVTFFLDYRGLFPASEPVPLSYVITSTALSVTIGALVVIKHHSNIQRLLNGTEKRINFGLKK